MKNLKRIEMPKMDLHPRHRLSAESMENVRGGGGCICYRNPFNINAGCACNERAFGLCKQVNGGGTPGGTGCTNNMTPSN